MSVKDHTCFYARFMIAFAISLVGFVTYAAESESIQSATDENIEEIVVTGERFKVDTEIAFQNLTRSNGEGAKLYKQGRYREALPYLLVGAKTGFKMSQARVGAIYLKGLGDVPKDVRKGLGWLGVASEPMTSPGIRNAWKKVLRHVPKDRLPEVEAIVKTYRENYGTLATGTRCEMTSNARSRIARLECTLNDELFMFATANQTHMIGCFSNRGELGLGMCRATGLEHLENDLGHIVGTSPFGTSGSL